MNQPAARNRCEKLNYYYLALHETENRKRKSQTNANRVASQEEKKPWGRAVQCLHSAAGEVAKEKLTK